ncbi:MAG TPA: tRNA lysidine(34) synthetase TilS [Bryobacteraceae bacterium]|nr:tRNA lysidine(34) synthetase TilS [Bryobacteraceae bacterium]
MAGTLVDRAAETISRYSMVRPADRVGVAVSGGADSVVLLHIFQRLAAGLQARLVVLHVNHHLRGHESDDDEQFVRSLAESFKLPIQIEHAPIGDGNLEQEARQARRNFFLKAMRQEGLVDSVALGHTRNDQAETVLFRLLRGSGLAGLAGMRFKTKEGLIRPLLNAGREEVRKWAESEGIAWREDSSNADLRFARNRLRHDVMPVVTQHFNPNLESTLSGTAALALAEENYWEEVIEPVYAEITKRTHFGLLMAAGSLIKLHIAVQRRVIRRALFDLRGDLRGLDMSHVEAILALCASEQGHDRVLVPGADALRSFDRLLLAAPGALSAGGRHYRRELSFGQDCELPFQVGSISVNWLNSEAQICANFKEDQELSEVVDLDGHRIASRERPECLAVRNWEPGDQLHRTGHQGAEKIKSLFQEYRVPLWERRHWPVLVLGSEIIWARQFGCAHHFKRSEESNCVVRLTFRPAE